MVLEFYETDQVMFIFSTDAAEKREGRIDQTPVSHANNQGSAGTYYNITAGMLYCLKVCMCIFRSTNN